MPTASDDDVCPFCQRDCTRRNRHHLVPKCRGGKETLRICRDCHRAVHELFPNKTLEREFSTADALMANADFQRMVAFIAKQDPTRKVRFLQSKRKWGRNG